MSSTLFTNGAMPEHLPATCPNCNNSFDTRANLQLKKTPLSLKIDKVINICSIIWVALSLYLGFLTITNDPRFILTIFGIVLIPILILRLVSHLLPQKMTLICYHCHWRKCTPS